MQVTKTISDEYESSLYERDEIIRKAKQSALYTIPTLMRSLSDSHEYISCNQSIGAQGVNHLASKLLHVLMPTHTSFARLSVIDKVDDDDDESDVEQVNQLLSSIERIIKSLMEEVDIRSDIFECLKHLIVTGNCLVVVNDTGKLNIIPIENYVIQRDDSDNVLKILIKKTVDRSTLPPKYNQYTSLVPDNNSPSKHIVDRNSVDIYTKIYRKKNKWVVEEEIENNKYHLGYYDLDKSPYIPLRFTKLYGNSYGASHVDNIINDLVNFDKLTSSLTDTGHINSKVLFIVSPSSSLDINKLSRAQSGDFVTGEIGDISTLQVNKASDYNVANNIWSGLRREISDFFFMGQAVTRPAERVTAEEIRYMARQIDESLGGVVSILSQEMQLPLYRRFYSIAEKKKIIPLLPAGTVEPVIVTGIAAFARSFTLESFKEFASVTMNLLGPDAIGKYLSEQELLMRIASDLGLEIKSLLKPHNPNPNDTGQTSQQAPNTPINTSIDGVMPNE
ncbi:MAG: portal protein [Candidatus Thiodiazotropha endolucinida]